MDDTERTPAARIADCLARAGLGWPELRFFALCYACALIVFLVMLS